MPGKQANSELTDKHHVSTSRHVQDTKRALRHVLAYMMTLVSTCLCVVRLPALRNSAMHCRALHLHHACIIRSDGSVLRREPRGRHIHAAFIYWDPWHVWTRSEHMMCTVFLP